MLKLFYAVGTCALASHIALEEAGAQYETVRLNFADGEQRKPEYLKVNPKGRVPALVTDKGVLTETPAILAYIAQLYPRASLAPRSRVSVSFTGPSGQKQRFEAMARIDTVVELEYFRHGGILQYVLRQIAKS